MREKREAKLYHALITVGVMAVIMFTAIVLFDATPHIPLVLGCLAAGLVAVSLGYSWEEILEGMIEGITDSLEAILILLLIGVLVGAWIAAGTVPTMICYGLKLVSPGIFLPATMLICLLTAFAIGSWGTVGTIGLAFMGIGLALDIPAPLVAGSVISGAYMGEVISPLSDATNLAAAVAGENVFRIVKNTALKKYRANTAQKRNNYYDVILEEVDEFLAVSETVESEILAKEIGNRINVFLGRIKDRDRIMFGQR